jgi:oligoendopeptidase F
VAAEPRLEIYAHPLDDILRRAPHTLDSDREKLLASTNLLAGTPATVYNILTGAELPWPTVTLADGREVRIDQAAYTKYRAAPNREDRKKVYEAFWGKWAEFEQTMGVALYAELKKDLFYGQVRNYPSCLARALDADNVPETVYRTLIDTANANLPTLHRYLKLRGRMLGIDDLRYHDLYPPLVASDRVFPIEKGKRLVLEAVRPLGDDYAAIVETGFGNRWMDTYPRPGKRSGAYSSSGAYDVHPYVLMNYNDDYESVSTLAHEWGHAMHGNLANEAQPFPTAHYAIFVAEVASTFNEALLLEHVLKNAESDEERLYYLGSALEGLRMTFFRQTMFAEYELEIHELVERGEALSGERFTALYAELLERYHGHDAGVVTIDDAYALEWAYIPHFYYDFYVYKYATSIAAGSLFAREILDGKAGARDRYLEVLRAGGSKYPYDMLREAGVDLATPAPYEALIARMNAIMDQIEVILEKQRAG